MKATNKSSTAQQASDNNGITAIEIGLENKLDIVKL
mgnify:CR=1 FL=1